MHAAFSVCGLKLLKLLVYAALRTISDEHLAVLDEHLAVLFHSCDLLLDKRSRRMLASS